MQDILKSIDTDAGVFIESFRLKEKIVERNKVLAAKNEKKHMCQLLYVSY